MLILRELYHIFNASQKKNETNKESIAPEEFSSSDNE